MQVSGTHMRHIHNRPALVRLHAFHHIYIYPYPSNTPIDKQKSAFSRSRYGLWLFLVRISFFVVKYTPKKNRKRLPKGTTLQDLGDDGRELIYLGVVNELEKSMTCDIKTTNMFMRSIYYFRQPCLSIVCGFLNCRFSRKKDKVHSIVKTKQWIGGYQTHPDNTQRTSYNAGIPIFHASMDHGL